VNGLKNSTGGDEPESNSPTAGAKTKRTTAGDIRRRIFVIPFAVLNSQRSLTALGFPESLQASAQQGFISLRKQRI
jgi:hypothetical protein